MAGGAEYSISNLVFQGGGVRGAAYAGAVEVLAEQNLLTGVRQIAGTSAGAITAALLASGAGPDGLKQAILHTDFNSFLDGSWGVIGETSRLFSHFGLHQGESFEKILADYLFQFSGHSDLTFSQLRDKASKDPTRFKQLFVVASNITYSRAEVLCAENHPDMPIARAIRTSMSIPLLFEPVTVGKSLYVDGGLSWNYPIDLFDHLHPHTALPRGVNARRDDTLGFVLSNRESERIEGGEWEVLPQDTGSFTNFVKALGGFMYETANHQHLHPGDVGRTAFIDDLGVKSTNFEVSKESINALVKSGRVCTTAYIDYRKAAARGEVVKRSIPHAYLEAGDLRIAPPSPAPSAHHHVN